MLCWRYYIETTVCRHLNQLETRISSDVSQILKILQQNQQLGQHSSTSTASRRKKLIPHVQISVDSTDEEQHC